MSFRIVIYLSIFLTLFESSIAKKKYPIEDGNTWLSIGIKKNLPYNFQLSLSQELRYGDYSNNLHQSLSDIGLIYKISKELKVSLSFRYRDIVIDEETRDEIYSNFSYKNKINDFVISSRTRLHVKFRDNKESINNIRNLLSLGYEINKYIKPFVATEVFYRFLYDEGDRFSQARYSLGVDFIILEWLELEAFFTREEEYNNDKAINSNIIGLELGIEL